MALRLDVSAGANVVERLMAPGLRATMATCGAAPRGWMQRVELDLLRIDDTPRTFSGGMRQRMQIARNLVTRAAAAADGRADLGARRVGAGALARPAARAHPPHGRAALWW